MNQYIELSMFLISEGCDIGYPPQPPPPLPRPVLRRNPLPDHEQRTHHSNLRLMTERYFTNLKKYEDELHCWRNHLIIMLISLTKK